MAMGEFDIFSYMFEGKESVSEENSKEKDENVRIEVKNEEFMDDVIYDYNVKKGAIVVCAALAPIIPILMLVGGIVFESGPFIVLGFVSFMLGMFFCIELLEAGEECEKKLKDYKEAAVIFNQIKLKELVVEKGNLSFYFLRDDGTPKKRSFKGFTFEYVPYLEKDHIVVDLKKKCILISGKYLID